MSYQIRWLYLFTGKTLHALENPKHLTARCGRSPLWYDSEGWQGDNSRAQKEIAAKMSKCRQCTGLLAKDKLLERAASGS